MAGIHYRKIRNGKVLGAADFNAAVEVCTAARRCLQQLDASLQFEQLPDGAGLQQILPLIDGVLADYQQLKSGKQASGQTTVHRTPAAPFTACGGARPASRNAAAKKRLHGRRRNMSTGTQPAAAAQGG
jgi:hypothetical protein